MKWPSQEKQEKGSSLTLLDTDSAHITLNEDGLLVIAMIVNPANFRVNDAAWDTACVEFVAARFYEQEADIPQALFHAKVLSRLAMLRMDNQIEKANNFLRS